MWLERSKPTDLNQRIFRYHGLSWAGVSASELQREMKELLSLQRPDGGWNPLPALESDAWTTGHMLVAVHEAGALAISIRPISAESSSCCGPNLRTARGG